MQTIQYKGKKTAVFTMEDINLLNGPFSNTRELFKNQLCVLRVYGYEWVLVLVDLPPRMLPKELREIVNKQIRVYESCLNPNFSVEATTKGRKNNNAY